MRGSMWPVTVTTKVTMLVVLSLVRLWAGLPGAVVCLLAPDTVDAVELCIGEVGGWLFVTVGCGVGLAGCHAITATAIETYRQQEAGCHPRARNNKKTTSRLLRASLYVPSAGVLHKVIVKLNLDLVMRIPIHIWRYKWSVQVQFWTTRDVTKHKIRPNWGVVFFSSLKTHNWLALNSVIECKKKHLTTMPMTGDRAKPLLSRDLTIIHGVPQERPHRDPAVS